MSSIFVTGDIHGNPVRLGSMSFTEQKEFEDGQDNNFVIVCGDFGLVWDNPRESINEKYWLDWLEKKPFTTLFVTGNHENFDRLYSDEYETKMWHGGKVKEIRPHVLLLMRGEVFNILGMNFFAFGGASSHDIRDGILEPTEKEKIKQWRKDNTKYFRVNHVSWWKEEIPSESEMQNGTFNLEKHNWKVDFVITHSPSASVLALLGKGRYNQDVLTKYLEEIRAKLQYKKWFAGHMHVNTNVNTSDILIYEQIVRIV